MSRQAQFGGRLQGQRLAGLEGAGQRTDQAAYRRPVDLVLAAEVVEDLDPWRRLAGNPFVVGKLQVADYRAVTVAPLSRPQEHAT